MMSVGHVMDGCGVSVGLLLDVSKISPGLLHDVRFVCVFCWIVLLAARWIYV